MTAITYFFTDDGKKLTVIADRQVTDEHKLREDDKFFKKGRFYIFCAGSEDVYKNVIWDLNHDRRDITKLANFIRDKTTQLIQKRLSNGITEDACCFLIVDSKTFKAAIVNRCSVSDPQDFGILGIGEYHTPEIQDIFTKLVNTGRQLKGVKWNTSFYGKMVEAYHKLSFKESTIGHPALFGLDMFVFKKNNVIHETIRYKQPYSLNEMNYYDHTIN